MDDEKLKQLEELCIHRELEFLKASGDVHRALKKQHRGGAKRRNAEKFDRLIKRMRERGEKLVEVKRAIERRRRK